MIRSIAAVMLLAFPVMAQESMPRVEEPPTEMEMRLEQIAAEMKLLNDRMNVLIREIDLVDEKVEFLDKKMDSGFVAMDEKMNAGFARIDGEMNTGFARIDGEMALLSEKVELLDDKVDDGFTRMEKSFELMRGDLRLTRSEARTSVLNWILITFIPATILGGFIGVIVAWRNERRR